MCYSLVFFFFFNDTPPPEIYTLSLHDALPIFADSSLAPAGQHVVSAYVQYAPYHLKGRPEGLPQDRKSTRLNSSHGSISYAVFCLKKKKKKLNSIRNTIQYNTLN